MATPRSIIAQAFVDLGVTQPGELILPGGAIETAAFEVLQQMYGGWIGEDLMNFNAVEFPGTLIDNIDSYTLGIGGSFDTVVQNITRVTSWGARIGNFTSGGNIATIEQFHAAQNATARRSTLPELVAADTHYPLITIRVFPFPAPVYGVGVMATLLLKGWYATPAFATVTDALTLPPEYFAALHFNLAIALSPQFSRVGGVTPELAANAQNSKGIIVAKNAKILGYEPAAPQAAA